jgi:hypothetical protein
MSDICERLHQKFNTRPRFRFPFDSAPIPLDGIYILFETGELAHGGDRIVQVGTHTGQDQLRSRLKEHFIFENKDRSIFRKNIGRSLLAKAGDPFASDWELDLTTSLARKQHARLVASDRLRVIEREVSRFIQTHFTFAVFEVKDKVERLLIKARIISTVSLCQLCRPSPSWLGLASPIAKIRESGLWLVNELYKEPFTEQEMCRLEKILD